MSPCAHIRACTAWKILEHVKIPIRHGLNHLLGQSHISVSGRFSPTKLDKEQDDHSLVLCHDGTSCGHGKCPATKNDGVLVARGPVKGLVSSGKCVEPGLFLCRGAIQF